MKSAPQETWTIVEMLRWTIEYFRAKGVSEPRASAEVLLAYVLQVSRLELYLRYDQPLTPEELARFKALMLRRRDGEPVAYLTGQKEFWSLNFRVTPAVLIPRPETEVLVQAALEATREILGAEGKGQVAQASRFWESPAAPPLPHSPTPEADQPPQEWKCEELPPFPESQPKTANRKPKTGTPWGLEVGVGSGAVVVALARELPARRWLALDLSAAALAVARDNARRHGVAQCIEFLRADRLTPLKPGPCFNLVVANLPYVSRADWERLPKDIKDYEPQEALLAGEDGLALLRPLAQQAHLYLQDGGWLALEVGEGQAKPVLELLQKTGAYDRVEAVADYQGILRVVRARRRFSG
jgi:release factor glutamine methyltransferase